VWELLLQSGFNVIIPDLPGFWKTKLNKTFDLEEYAIVIEEFIKELWLDNIILWWHSNWWAIAIKIANRWKINISRLVLNNSAWIRNDKKRSLKRKILNKTVKYFKFLKKIFIFKKIRILFYKLIWWQDYLNAEKNPHLKQTYLNMISSDLQEEIKNVKNHTLLIWWKNDTYTPKSDWIFMRNNIKNSKIIILEDEKHWIHLTSPEKLVNTFLKNL
jgi:pimeloyl-ACP methyl ester carboxylesterase